MTFALHSIPPAIPLERRRAGRIKVSLPVEVEIAREKLIARVTELSRAGARLELRSRGATGDDVTLRRDGITIQAKIVWTDVSETGLWFPELLDEFSFLRLRRSTLT
jgi:hypothetical protein